MGESLKIPVQAEVILPPLHEHAIHLNTCGSGEERDILEENLFLKILCSCGNDGLFAAEHKRHQVTQGFARPCACFHNGRHLLLDGLLDQVGHLNL